MRKGTLVRECLLRASKRVFDTLSNETRCGGFSVKKSAARRSALAVRIIRDYDFFRTLVPKWYSGITFR